MFIVIPKEQISAAMYDIKKGGYSHPSNEIVAHMPRVIFVRNNEEKNWTTADLNELKELLNTKGFKIRFFTDGFDKMFTLSEVMSTEAKSFTAALITSNHVTSDVHVMSNPDYDFKLHEL